MFPFYEIFGFNVPKWGYLITNDTVFVCSDTHTYKYVNTHAHTCICMFVCAWLPLKCKRPEPQMVIWTMIPILILCLKQHYYRQKGVKKVHWHLWHFFFFCKWPPGEKWPIWKWTEASINWRRTLTYKQQVPVILLRRGLLFGVVLKDF